MRCAVCGRTSSHCPDCHRSHDSLRRTRVVNPQNMRTIREDLGLTQADVAARLGVKKDTLGRWERGESLSSRQLEWQALMFKLDEAARHDYSVRS